MNKAKNEKFATWIYKSECVRCEIQDLLVEENREEKAEALPVDPDAGTGVCKATLDLSQSGGGRSLATFHRNYCLSLGGID